MPKVYVLNRHGRPLMPCTPAKARHLLDAGKAKYDKVLYNGIECFVWGRRTSGSFLLRQLNGEKVKDGVSYKHLKLLERSQSYLVA